MSKLFKGVIFDLDGTLLNSIEDIADAVNATLVAYGYKPHDIEKYKYYVGDGMRKLAMRVLPQESQHDELLMKFLETMQLQYKDCWNKKSHLYTGVDVLLNSLTKNNVLKAILSNKPHAFTVLAVAHFFSAWHFDAVYGARADIGKKPDPTASMSIAARFQCAPQEIIHVGDTDTDMQTAKAAGMYAVGVTWGFRTRDELQQSGADRIIDRPVDLLPLLCE